MAMSRHVEIDIESDADTSGFLSTAAAADRAASKVDELGDQMRGTARDAAALDVAMMKTKAIVHQLGEEFAQTRKEDVGKMLREQRGVLTSLQQIGQETDKISLGSLFHGATVDADLLNRKIRETKIAVDELGAAYVKSGDKDVLKSLREQRGTLQVLQQIAKELRETAQASDNAANKTEKLGDKLRSTAQGAHTLEERIEASKKAVIALGDEFVRTGDRDVFKNLSEERGMLRNLQQMRKEISLFGEGAKQAGRDFGDLGNVSGVISTAFKMLPAEAKAALAGVVASLMPAIGSLIGSAVLLAVGGGSLTAAIIGAFKSARVSDVFSSVFSDMSTKFVAATGPLADPLVRAAFKIGDAFDSALPGIEKGMQKLAPVTDHLASGLIGFVTAIGPGFSRAFDAAIPFLHEVADTLPVLGSGISYFFAAVATGGPGAAAFFHDLVNVLVLTFQYLGNTIALLEIMYSAMSGLGRLMVGDASGALVLWQQFGAVIGPVAAAAMLATGNVGGAAQAVGLLGDKSKETSGPVEELKRKMEEAGREQAYKQGMQEAARITQEAKQAVEGLKNQLSDLATQILNGKNAELAWKQGRLDMIDALKATNGVLDENTRVGIAAEQSMVRQAENAVAVRNSILKQTGDMPAADAAWQSHIDQLYRDAEANKITKERVDEIIGALKDLPRPDPIDVELKRLGLDDVEIARIKAELDRVKGNYVANVITNRITRYSTEGLPIAPRGQFQADFAKGGIVHADTGVITSPGIYRGRGNGMVVAAEGVTGHEGFVPQLGISRGRAATLLSEMARWHGYGLYDQQDSGYGMPAMPSTVGGSRVNLLLSVAEAGSGIDQALASFVMYAIRTGLIQLKTDGGDRVRVG